MNYPLLRFTFEYSIQIKLKKFILLFGLISFQTLLLGQWFSGFSNDPKKFIVQLENRYKGLSAEAVADFTEFKNNWNTGLFSPDQQRYLIEISQKMRENDYAMDPIFRLFYRDYTKSLTYEGNKDLVNQWREIANQMVGGNPVRFQEFLEFTDLLLYNHALFSNSLKRWEFDSTAEFKLGMQGGRFYADFSNIILSGKAQYDTVILETKGRYYAHEKIWDGEFGKVFLRNTDPKDSAFVTFDEFQLKLQSHQIIVDSAFLHYPRFAEKPISGSFHDKLVDYLDSLTPLTQPKFPRFNSFDNNIPLNNILGPNSKCVGGLGFKGLVFNTSTVDSKESIATIPYDGKDKVVIKNRGFVIYKGLVNGEKCAFQVELDSGKYLKHPSVNLSFNYEKNTLFINKGDDGLMRGVFRDEYHNMDIDVQSVRWKLDEPFMDFDNLNDEKPAFFTSKSYFRKQLYDDVRGVLASNPIDLVYTYYTRIPNDELLNNLYRQLQGLSEKTPVDRSKYDPIAEAYSKRKSELERIYITEGRKEFTIEELCEYYKCQPRYLEHMFIDLHDDGYVEFDFKNGKVKVLDKLTAHYFMSRKFRDYDVIKLGSIISAKPNGTLNLKSNELQLEGVAPFHFSDSQNVYVVPFDQKVLVTNDRGLHFGGRVRAGRFDFFGKNFNFDYSKFQIEFEVIDSMKMYFPEEKTGRLVPIKSVFRNIGGTLFIDKPNNKSGNKHYPEYPIFTSNRGGDILYDKPSIHGGQYIADRFKFTVDPFTIDSLDDFTIDGLTFDGTFYSADIFPVFRHYVYIQPDYSLGFVKPTPAGGLPMYKGKGNGDMTLNLSEVGFYGETGKIDYETSETRFTRILMLPEKTLGPVNSYDLKANSKYAKVLVNDARLDWIPYNDKFKITTQKYPMATFVDQLSFRGTTTQSPSKIIGDGELSWDLAKFRSKEMLLKPRKATASKSSLDIYTLDTSKMAFSTDNITADLDFKTRIGKFNTNDVGQLTYFPFNSYQTNLSNYVWKMNDKTIAATIGSSMGGITPDWMSINNEQDSLNFIGKKGLYDMKDYTLKVSEIPYIDIADSRLYTKDGIAMIRENANMDTLKSCKWIANRNDSFHTITESVVKVLGKYQVWSQGKVNYVTRTGKKQEVFLDAIGVDMDHHLAGEGKIDERQGFTLDTKIGYRGEVSLTSVKRGLDFQGYVIANHTFGEKVDSKWARFNQEVNPQDVIIEMKPPKAVNGQNLFVGLAAANDSSHVYAVLFGGKRRLSDNEITYDTGVFYWDADKNSFFAGDVERLRNGKAYGNFIQFNESNHEIHAEGEMEFGVVSKNVDFRTAGTADLKKGDSAFQFQLAMLLNFPLHDNFKKRMVEMFLGEEEGNETVNTLFNINALSCMIKDDKTREKLVGGLETTNRIKSGGSLLGSKDERDVNFIISGVDLKWDYKARGMYGESGSQLISMCGTPINKSITTTMYLEARRGSQRMHFYISDGSNMVYFYVTPYNVSIFTNDPELTKIMSETNNKVKVDNWSVSLSSERRLEQFLRKVGLD